MVRTSRTSERVKRHKRIRRHVHGTAERPRLCVRKTLRHFYAQIIDDDSGRTLAQTSTLDPAARGQVRGPNVAAAKLLGAQLAAAAKEKGIEAVVFDRGGYLYHGVVSAFAEACREGGLRL
jgi:large subunit ribosomal protein L18